MADEPKKPQTIECRLCRKPKRWEGPFAPHRSEIDEWSKVCKECIEFWELGKKAAKAAKSDGKDTETRVPSLVPVNPKLGDAGGPTVVKGLDIIAAMGGISLRGTEMGSKFGGSGERLSIVEMQDKGDWTYVGGGSLPFKVPKARAIAMQKVVTAFLNAIAKTRVDGFNEGRNLLAGLAKGELKLEDFDVQTDNARAGKKPKKRWGE